MSVTLLRADARRLPLPDESVDLLVTSPPFWQLRSYQDGGKHYDGQIGSESTAAEYIDALLNCTAEWMRVLKPSGSMFIELGDKYGRGTRTTVHGGNSKQAYVHDGRPGTCVPTGHDKSLLQLPQRFAIACTDQLSLVLRAEIIWHHSNGLPESVADRVRRAHSTVYHLTKQGRYYTAVDEIRLEHQPQSVARARRNRFTPDRSQMGVGSPNTLNPRQANNPLGGLPGSVWDIPSQPLIVPDRLALDHFAAMPMELPRRIILGWSPPGICIVCNEGRRPVVDKPGLLGGDNNPESRGKTRRFSTLDGGQANWNKRMEKPDTITGYACACTPYTDHPGRERDRKFNRYANGLAEGSYESDLGSMPRTGPWREYHLDQWEPPPTRPAVVVDPFGGTGTTAIVAHLLGRTGISADLSMDYARIAKWRTTDPGERAKALGVPKPPPVPDNQPALFSLDELEGLR